MNDRVAALLRAAQEDEQLRTSLKGASSVGELVQVAAAAGFEVSVADFDTAAASEVSDAEMEGVVAARQWPWTYVESGCWDQ